MKITFDPNQRNETLRVRGLDFADANKIFAGDTLTIEDTRHDYGETRLVTIGFLEGRMVMLVGHRAVMADTFFR